MKDKLCPRAKGKEGKRIKLAITLDEVNYNKLQELYQEGYSISHLIDSALWSFFDKHKLSFEKESPTLFDKKPVKCCGEEP
jgi:hypothetical protein